MIPIIIIKEQQCGIRMGFVIVPFSEPLYFFPGQKSSYYCSYHFGIGKLKRCLLLPTNAVVDRC